jgi:predicted ABC-type ATPase
MKLNGHTVEVDIEVRLPQYETIAAIMIKHRQQLIAGGFSHEIAEDMVRQLHTHLLDQLSRSPKSFFFTSSKDCVGVSD